MVKKLPFGKTWLTTLYREIRGSLGRFTALFGIVALGVGFLAGLLSTTPDMKASADRYFDRNNMMDILVKGTLGITPADIEAVAALPEVAEVQGIYVSDEMVKTPEEEVLVCRIFGLPLEKIEQSTFINRMEFLKGRMPQTPNECLVHEGGGFFANIRPGAVLAVSGDPEELSGRFRTREFTVTGIVRSPLFLSFEREPSLTGSGRLAGAVYVREEAFALPVRTDLHITLKGAAALDGFSKKYRDLVKNAKEKLEALGKERSLVRGEEVRAEVRKKLEEGEREINRNLKELETGEKRIARGRAALEKERRKAGEELEKAAALLDNGEAELAGARRLLAEAKAKLDEARDEVEKTRTSRARMAVARAREGVAQYDAGLREWEAGQALIAEKEEELRRGRTALEAARLRAREELDGAARELNAAAGETVRGRRQIGEAREKLEARRNPLTEEPRWYVLDRDANVGAVNYRFNAEKIDSVARVFPVFFLLVAALVALTTMTRMVEEERLQIGTLKALGYQKRVIAAKYLIYCGLTSILGSAAGMAGGFRILPAIVYNAFGTRYRLPPLVTELNWGFGLTACGLVLGCTMGVTLSACYRTLREKPAALMLPRAPRAGKRIILEYIPLIWRRMKFTHKVTARNLLRYKKHFFMTLTGIAGCTALMLTGFGLRDSLVDIARTQFEDILLYDLRIDLQEKKTDDALEDFFERYPEHIMVRNETGTIRRERTVKEQDEDEPVTTSVMVPQDPAALANYIRLGRRKAGGSWESPEFKDDSAVITRKMATALGMAPGDRFSVENGGGKKGECTLSAITENYVGNYLYLGKAAYRAAFGEEPEPTAALLKTGITGPGEQDETIAAALVSGAVTGAEFTSQVQQSYNNLLSSIGFVVVILIAAAGGLAVIVLYNLTNINITERTRELATLRVLGFHHREAAAYIFREITVLCILGAAAGLVLGIPLHRFIIGVAENVDLMFGRRISAPSFILSALITLFFSGAVNLLMARKIRAVKMAESMKAVD